MKFSAVNIRVGDDLEKALKLLKKDFENNVIPELKKHQYHRSKSQLRKEKPLIKTNKKMYKEG